MIRPAGASRLRAEWWLVALISTLLTILLTADRTAIRLDNLIYDNLLRLTRRAPQPDILLVTIDNRSLKEVGPWPWPRARHAALLQRIDAPRPRAILYDVLFVEPGAPADDAALGRAMASVAAPVIVPLLLSAPGSNGAAFDDIQPIAPVRAAAAGIGHASLAFDADGLVRRFWPAVGDARHIWPHLAVLAHRRDPAVAEPGRNPASPEDGPQMIAFAGPPGHFPTISASAVLRGEVPADFIAGRTILVGATADGLGDQYPTPFAGRKGVMSGVEIVANVLDSMEAGRTIRPVEGIPLLVGSLLPLWLLLAGFRMLSPRRTVLLLAGLVALVAAAVAGLLLGGIWFAPASALIALAIIYPLWGWRRLAAVSAYMVRELERLGGEPAILPYARARPRATDVVDRQVQLLEGAIADVRDLRRFATDRLHQMPDAVFVLDPTGAVLLMNGDAERLLRSLALPGGTGMGIAGLLAKLRLAGGPEGATPSLPSAAPADATQANDRPVEAIAPDGRWFDIRFARQYSGDGTAAGWIARFIDISAAKAAQRQQDDLRQLLTHDMRSPQASILAVIDNSKPGEVSEEIGRRIRGYAQRTLDLADGFVQLARAHTLAFVKEEIDLAEILIDAVDDLWPQSSGRAIAIAIEGERNDLIVAGDRSLLTRALINLIDNAIKYSPDGGRILCRLDRAERDSGPVGLCAIRDQGIGIAPDQIALLFEPFQRAPGADAAHIDGVGLGLAFVRTVMARHGGIIRCESRPGEGTTFTIELPLMPPEAAD
ncbi:CHASE2 domain-containing protein [Edaphosphingomonas haloaromaticamans]|uniref:histidine kinase n=1 Tax=Edaphosphingomonas haloaromaticamans TaxID=653954 RepID=A0A1S1HIQ7_9SPHN|nr:CHASE2 domain-containing protein [Sphingomonas haloaromaticamans]OHT21103.1 Sensor histidine kinase YycG [Sphingomonas haloaromaticamans]